MKPTKRQRNSIYKKTLRYVKSHGWQGAGFCFNIGENSEYETYDDGMKNNFPEIYKRKPKTGYEDCYYFKIHDNEDLKREAILRLAIKETNPKVK